MKTSTRSSRKRRRTRRKASATAELARTLGRKKSLEPGDIGKLLSAVEKDMHKRPSVRQRMRSRRATTQKQREAWTETQLETHHWQRLQVAPVFATSAVWVTGECAHFLALAINTPNAPLITAASASFLAATAGFVIRIANRKRWVRRWSVRYWIAATVATVWTFIATFPGANLVLTGLLTLALVLLGSRWWRAYRLPWRREALDIAGDDDGADGPDDSDPLAMPWRDAAAPVEPTPEAEEDAEDAEPIDSYVPTERDLLVNRWTTLIARPGLRRKLANSALTNYHQLVNGHQFDVDLDCERATFQMLQKEHPTIAGVFGLPMSSVIIVPHPTRDNSRGQITFLTYNPLIKGIRYRGPRYAHGLIDAGLYQDGAGWGSVQLTDHRNSVMNGLVTGDPGSGKSIFLENLGLSAKKSGCWKVLYCDGSPDGDSSPVLSEHMDWPTVGLRGAWAQLAAVKRYMKGRGLQNAAMPPKIRGVNPSADRVGLLWIIDEFHLLTKADKRFAAEVEKVIRLGRKKGVSVWVATQGLDLELDFAGISTLRDILTSRNVLAFYSSSKYAHTLISGVTIAPNTLPTDGGYFYLSRPGMPHRNVMLRTDYADDMTLWAEELADVDWDDLAYWCVEPIAEKFRLPPEMAREESEAKLAAYYNELRHGKSLTDRPGADADTQDEVDADQFDELVADLSETAAGYEYDEGPDQRPDGEEQTGPELDLKPQHYDVLNALKAGPLKAGSIVDAVDDFSRRTIFNALRDLTDADYITSVKGTYELVRQMQDA